MKNFLLGMLASIALPILLALAVFLFVPRLYFWHDIYSAIPDIIIRSYIQSSPSHGDFLTSAKALERQANIAELLGANSRMKRDLVRNSTYVMDMARYKEHYVEMLPWLKRLNKIAGEQYLARLMLAEAEIFAGDGLLAKNRMKAVRDLSPVYDRAYRPVIEAALLNRDYETVNHWCEAYASAQSGSFDPIDFERATYEGQGVGHFYIETRDGDGKLTVLPHQGFRLNERRQYSFELANIPGQSSIKLHIPSLPGVKVEIFNVSFSGSGSDEVIAAKNLILTSKHGYFLDQTSVLIGSYAGDVITFFPKSRFFPASNEIKLDIKFSRLAIANSPACQ
jgi:hypothetical protein